MLALRATRYIIGATIMLTHFATVAIYVFLGSGRMEMPEVLQGVATVAPVAAIYVTTFLNYVVNTPAGAPDEIGTTMRIEAFLVQYVIVVLFCAALAGLPLYTFTTGQLKYEDASLYTGGIDTVFAGYLGLIFKKLFPLGTS